MTVEALLKHPALWKGRQQHEKRETFATGYTPLNAALPSGGWPVGALTELMVAHEGVGEFTLLLPALAALTQQQQWIALVAPPIAAIIKTPTGQQNSYCAVACFHLLYCGRQRSPTNAASADCSLPLNRAKPGPYVIAPIRQFAHPHRQACASFCKAATTTCRPTSSKTVAGDCATLRCTKKKHQLQHSDKQARTTT